MKKFAIIFILLTLLFCVVSCDDIDGTVTTTPDNKLNPDIDGTVTTTPDTKLNPDIDITISPIDIKADELITKRYEQNEFIDLCRDRIDICELNSKYPMECVRVIEPEDYVYGDEPITKQAYRVTYYGKGPRNTSLVVFRYFDYYGKYLFDYGLYYQSESTKSDFEAFKAGDHLNKLGPLNLDTTGSYEDMFWELCTSDGYLIRIYINEDSIITDIKYYFM